MRTRGGALRQHRKLCAEVLTRPDQEIETITAKLDRIFLHPVLGFVNLLLVLGILFFLIFKVAEGPMGWIEAGFGELGSWVETFMSPGDLRDLIVNGVVPGVSGVVIFLPQILILFFFIGIMEDTGYMSRLAFIMDWLMSKVGLNGKVVPALPQLLCLRRARRHGRAHHRQSEGPPHHHHHRAAGLVLGTSAGVLAAHRRAVPGGQVSAWVQAGIMLSLYALGTDRGFFFAWIFSKCVMKGVSQPDDPGNAGLQAPALKSSSCLSGSGPACFLVRAGTIILGISILIWAASTYPKTHRGQAPADGATASPGSAGKFIEPAIAPLGYDWKIGIGLIGSFAAREVFNSTMGVVYAVESDDDDNLDPLRDKLARDGVLTARPSIHPARLHQPARLLRLRHAVRQHHRHRQTRDRQWKWAMFQLGYMTGTAYLLSLLIFQIGSALGY
jgi:ferrous iron transport protein B